MAVTMRDRSPIHVVMVADSAYRPGLEAARASMLRSCSMPERIVWHVFDETNVSAARIEREFGTYKGSVMTFVRLYLTELLPDCDWVVYSDVDTLWFRDVAELWDLRDEAKSVQWVPDMASAREESASWQRTLKPDFDTDRYGCCGVMLMNLAQMRQRHLLETARAFTLQNGLFRYVDQDILNALCNESCGLLPECWDVLIPSPENVRGGCVLHITGVGRCFRKDYQGKVPQYRLWEHVVKGYPLARPMAFPFYVRSWMIRLVTPFATSFFRDRVRRRLAFWWFVSRCRLMLEEQR